jgi:hypothetical protein
VKSLATKCECVGLSLESSHYIQKLLKVRTVSKTHTQDSTSVGLVLSDDLF